MARWLGDWAVAAVATWLAWEQVSDRLPQWSLPVLLGGIAFLAFITAPLGINDDGSTRRLFSKTSGRSNSTLASGDHSPVSGNVIIGGKGHTVVVVTPAEARQISNDTGRNELMRDTKAITMPDARAQVDETLNQRFGELTDTLIEHINERDTKLFSRFADPRFLGPLGIAHRSYSELGSEDLRTTLSGLLTDLAGRKVGTRREIFLRQAIDVTRVLTSEHINALAVKVLIASFKLDAPYETDMLIRSLDTLLSPYYARIPKSRLDYQYMSSTGVCQDGQLGVSFSHKPFQALYEKYRNSMYPGLTYSELKDNLLNETSPHFEEAQQLLWAYVESEDDIQVTQKGTTVSENGARFRIVSQKVDKVLSTRNGAELQLSSAEKALRDMILERMISQDQFAEQISALRPDLFKLLSVLEKTDALAFPLHPVGFVLAQHEIQSRTPQFADQIEEALDDEVA